MTTRRSGSDPRQPVPSPANQIAATNGQNGKHVLPALPAKPVQDVPSLEPAFLWYVLRKWFRVAALSGLVLAAGISALVWYLHVPVYRANFLVKITDKQKAILSRIEQTEAFVENQRVLLRSTVLLNRLLQREDIAKLPDLAHQLDPEAWLRKRLDVKNEARSNVFNVSFETANPAHAATVLNALIDEYFNYYLQEARRSSDQVLAVLTKERSYQLEEVKHRQEKVNELFEKGMPPGSLIFDPYRSLVGFNPQTQALFQQLILKEVERTPTDVHLKQEEAAAKKPIQISPAELDAEIAANPYVRKLEFDIRLMQDAFSKLTSGTKPYKEHQDAVRKMSDELKDYREKLKQEIPRLKHELIAGERALKIADLRKRLETLDAEILSLRQRIAADLAAEKGTIPARLDLALAQVDLERAKTRLSKVDDEIWRIKVEMPGNPAVERLQEQADVSKAPVEVVPYKKMAAFSLFGLFLPFGFCVFGELFARRAFRSQQVGQEANLPVLGEVATIPRRPRIPRPGGSRRYQRDRSVYEESVDSLRVTLGVCDDIGDAKVLVIASAVSGEGKSTLAARLAFSWARGAGEKVLLIDADLRAPDQHRFFEIDVSPGLGEVLLGEKRPEEVIVDWGHGLHVMPAGRVAISPHRLFSNGALHELIAAARKTYDRIVIDVPPILGAGESLQIAKEADGVLYCARKDVSRMPQVKMACDRLELSGARVLGCVFIGVENAYYSKSR